MGQREYIRWLMFIQMSFFFKEFHPIMSASDDYSLSTNQDTNQFFGVSKDWTLDILFNYQKLYQLN